MNAGPCDSGFFLFKKALSSGDERARLEWKLRDVIWGLFQACSKTRLKMSFLTSPSSLGPKERQELRADTFVQKWKLKDRCGIRAGRVWR